MRTAKNDITGANLTTATKPMTDARWEAIYERIRETKNPRYWYEDTDGVLHDCEVCTKEFFGSINRKLCKFCV